jgi:hypothetical protein
LDEYRGSFGIADIYELEDVGGDEGQSLADVRKTLAKFILNNFGHNLILNMGLFSALIGNAGAVAKGDLIKDYGKLLIDNEDIELGFKLIRDVFIFTNKRLILI